MEKLIFTQLSVSEVRQLLREELQNFFQDKRNIDGLSQIVNCVSFYKDETNIDDIDMSVRLYNGLKNHKINTFGEMRSLQWKQFNQSRTLGIKSWNELQNIINRVI